MAHFLGAGNARIGPIENNERTYRNTSFGTNGNDSESMDSHDSDSDESFTCEYDSTWDEEVDTSVLTRTRSKKKKRRQWSWSNRRNTNAAKDMQTYRHDYPGMEDPPPCQIFPQHPNLKFYKNEINSQPDDVSILDFHEKWRHDYIRLERVHTFIQWLFPIREDGVNFQAYKLTKDEIKAFNEDKEAKERLRESYELMLDFYGIKLVDHETGEVQRAENWEEQFQNLNRYTHNNLRITRILKCLGILGFENYQAPLVRFFLKETLENGQLQNVRSSALDYFLFSVLDKEQRKELIKEAFAMFQKRQGNGRSREKFVWCPKWVQKRFKEELNSKQTGTKRIMQNLSSVNETQPTIEVGPSEQNKPELEKEEGSSEDKFHKKGETVNKEPISSATLDDEPLSKKHSDEDTETSGSEGDGEEDKNTQVAGDNVKVQSDITAKEQGECTNKPTVMAIKDSSVSGCSVKPQLDSDNNSHGNKEVGPTGGPTDPPGKADEFKDDLNLEAKRDPVSACSIKTQQFDSDNVQYCTNQGDCHDTIQDKTSTVSQEKIKGSQAHGNQEVGPNDPPGKAEEFKDDLNEEGCLNAKSGDLQGQNTQSGADNSHPVSACSIKTQQFDSDNGQYCTNQGDCHITIQNETLPDLTMVSQEGMLAHGNQEVGPAGGSTETLGKAEFKDDHSACSQHAINVENKDITVREGSEGQCCRNEVIQQITRL